MRYNIISTGSKGNAVVIDNKILVDCGVSFKALKDVFKGLKIVLLTHIHTDHFNIATIKKLAEERPTLRFACGCWLVKDLVYNGIPSSQIDILEFGKIYDYGIFKISNFKLYHDVENCGYRIFIGNKKCLYATDTSTMEGIQAQNYDLYLIEANYGEDEIIDRILAKKKAGVYSYEVNVAERHLSKEQADKFLQENMCIKSNYVYLHMHEEKE